MKTVNKIPAYILSFIYLVFSTNYFFHFLTMPPMAGDAGAFTGLLYTTGFLAVVKVLEIVIAVLLIVPATTALAALLMAPISISILMFELLIAHQPGIGILLVILNALIIYSNREKYFSIVRVAI